jgi:hypothetical protein
MPADCGVKCEFAGLANTHTAPATASNEMAASQRLLLPKRSFACFNNMFFLR